MEIKKVYVCDDSPLYKEAGYLENNQTLIEWMMKYANFYDRWRFMEKNKALKLATEFIREKDTHDEKINYLNAIQYTDEITHVAISTDKYYILGCYGPADKKVKVSWYGEGVNRYYFLKH